MDPVKEKLNLLKKIASEKKSSSSSSVSNHADIQEISSSKVDDNIKQQKQEQLKQLQYHEANQSNQQLKQDNINNISFINRSTTKATTNNTKPSMTAYHQVEKVEQDAKEEEDNKVENKLDSIVDEANSFLESKLKLQNEEQEEEEEDPNEENSTNCLIVYDDNEKSTNVLSHSNLSSDLSNMDIKMILQNSETANANYRQGIANPANIKISTSQKPANKSFTVAPSQAEPTSKYINRIRDLYDKERASSTESIHHLKLKTARKQITPQSSLQSSIAVPEATLEHSNTIDLNSDQDDQSNISQSISQNASTASAPNNSNQRATNYISHLRNTFSSNLIRSDSTETTKRNSFSHVESNGQIDKLREKFSKVEQHSQNRNSFAYPNEISKSNSLYKSMRSLKPEEQPAEKLTEPVVLNPIPESPSNVNLAEVKKSPSRQLHKYQKSKTSDLSDLILEKESSKFADSKVNLDLDVDVDRRLIDKFSFDNKYQAENSIIKSTLSISSSNNNLKPHRNSLDHHNYSLNRNEFKHETSLPLTSNIISNPVAKRTKSILKSPSTINEKSIHFDDHIDVIQIERLSNNDSPLNMEPTNSLRKSHEIESIKKMLLKPNENSAPISANFRSNQNKNRVERIFVKSPTPMREIVAEPLPNESSSSSFINKNYLSINNRIQNANEEIKAENLVSASNGAKNSRNRFALKKNAQAAYTRSQSVDLSKFTDSSSFNNNNFNLNNSNLVVQSKPNVKLMSPAPVNRPNLTRQNALIKSYAKSLGEGLDKTHGHHKSEKSRGHHRTHHQKHNRHGRHYYKRKNKRSSSLTSSSSSFRSSDEEINKTESSTSYTSSSDERFKARDREIIPKTSKLDRKRHSKGGNEFRTLRKSNKLSFYSSDDSVCGIPKSSAKLAISSSRLCSSGKAFHKSMDELAYNREIPLTSNNNLNPNKNAKYEHPSFDDRDGHLSRNPLGTPYARHKIHPNDDQSIYYSTVPAENTQIMPNETVNRKISTGSMKSDNSFNQSVRKPLPSYSQIIQSNGMYARYQPGLNVSHFNLNEQDTIVRNRNSAIVNFQQAYSSQMLNNNATNNLNLYSLNDPSNQRITQPYQQNLLNQITSNPPQPPSFNQYQALPQPSLNQHSHLQKLKQNNFLTNQQQSRSKSMDASLCMNHSNVKIYENDEFRNNNNSYEDQLIMPYQSAAIQEKLKKFEQISTNEVKQTRKQPTIQQSLQNEPQQQLHRGLNDETRISDSNSNKLQSTLSRKTPFETNNKENSPFSTPQNTLTSNSKNSLISQNLSFFQNASSTSQSTMNRQTHHPYLKINNSSSVESNQRNSPSKFTSVSNFNVSAPAKIQQEPSKVNFFNANLTAATAAAAAAVAQQQQQNNQIKIENNVTTIYTPNLIKNSNQQSEDREKSLEKFIINNNINNNKSTVPTSAPKSINIINISSISTSNSNEPSGSDGNASRRNSFQKSTLSPLKIQNKNLATSPASQPEDVEMLSSASTSSASSKSTNSSNMSNKENKHQSNQSNIEVSSSNEPSKLSISEKLKLFSNSTTNNNNNTSINNNNNNNNSNVVGNYGRIKSNNAKTNFNRFQTQPVSIADLDYVNKMGCNLNSAKSFSSIDKESTLKGNVVQQQLQQLAEQQEIESKQAYDNSTIQRNKQLFESRITQNQSDSNNENNVTMMEIKSSENENTENQSLSREPKRYLAKSKTDFIPLKKDQEESKIKSQIETSPPRNEAESASLVGFGMTIQERMAALKKVGEEDWRKRSNSNDEQLKTKTNSVPVSSSNLVKQQREQLQLQMNQINNKAKLSSTEQPSALGNTKRNIFLPFLNEAKVPEDNDDNDINCKKNKMSLSNESLNDLVNRNNKIIDDKPQFTSKSYIFNNEKQFPSNTKQTKLSRDKSGGGSDTDSMLARNTQAISKRNNTNNTNQTKKEKVEPFSTDSEMESFFNDDSILNNNMFSSSSSPNKTDDNTMNEDFEEEEFDQIVSDAKRLTQGSRPKPKRVAPAKGNHLKNLQKRAEIKNEYEQKSPEAQSPNQFPNLHQQHAMLANEISRLKKFDKIS